MSFRGIIAERKYSWGYDCEHCKQKVTKTFTAAARVGQEVKASTWTYVTPEGEKAMIAQALNQLAHECEAIDSFWTRRSDDDAWLDGITDEGICPLCGKYQHWSPGIRKHKFTPGKKSTIGEKIVGVVTTLIISAIVTGVLYFIGAIFGLWQSRIFNIVMIGVYGLLAALIGFFFTKEAKKLAVSVENLKDAEKTLPYQMTWNNATHQSVGLSVR